jgi:cytochrome b561
MTIGDTVTTWGPVSRVLHWLAAALVLVLILHGFWMTGFAPRGAHFPHYAWHASLGYALIALMFVWLFWRLGNTVPRLPAAPAWEQAAMSAGHWLLYAMVFAAAFSGWALAGTAHKPLDSVFGILRLPPIVNPDPSLHSTLGSWHSIAAWTLAALVALHIAVVVWHWIVRKDGVMQRMFRSAPQ